MRYLAAWIVALTWPTAGLGQTEHFTRTGGSNGRMGTALAPAGDMDLDGFEDVVVGLLGNGEVRVLSGVDGSIIWLRGGGTGDNYGERVAGGGDHNDDGVPDFMAAERLDDANGASAGAVWVYSGADSTNLYTLRGGAANDRFGTSVAACGDLDGDQVDDLLVGAIEFTTGPGYVQAISGATGTVIHTIPGEVLDDGFGIAVGAADTNNDGVDDVLVGADQNGAGGAVYVFDGVTGKLIRKHPGLSSSTFGTAVGPIGDIDDDGHEDYYGSAPGEKNAGIAVGAVILFSGKTGQEIRRFWGRQAFGDFGISVGGGQDVNGDGVLDLVIGERDYTTPAGSDAGGIHVFSTQGELLYTMDGATASARLGAAVTLTGDMNGDGLGEIMAGADWWSGGGGLSGKVYALSGSATRLDLRSDVVTGGDKLSFHLQGDSGRPYAVFFLEVDGIPYVQFLRDGFLNGQGQAQLNYNVPGGLGSHDLEFIALTLDTSGQLTWTNVDPLHLR